LAYCETTPALSPADKSGKSPNAGTFVLGRGRPIDPPLIFVLRFIVLRDELDPHDILHFRQEAAQHLHSA
jgi:hypothetical protein